MVKFTSVVLGILTAGAIAQPSFAMNAPTATSTPVVDRADSNLHAQLILNIGGQRREAEYRREREQERERARREARHHRYSERDRGEHREHHEDRR